MSDRSSSPEEEKLDPGNPDEVRYSLLLPGAKYLLENPPNRRKAKERNTKISSDEYTEAQDAIMRRIFYGRDPEPDDQQYRAMAVRTGLPEKKVRYWFKERRAADEKSHKVYKNGRFVGNRRRLKHSPEPEPYIRWSPPPPDTNEVNELFYFRCRQIAKICVGLVLFIMTIWLWIAFIIDCLVKVYRSLKNYIK